MISGLRRRLFSSAPSAPALMPHDETLLTLEQTAIDRRFEMPFLKTYDYEGEVINAEHAALATCPARHGMIDIGIEGWLLPADAMKLYELAYFAPGDMLELGTFRGLSAEIMRRAVVASFRPRKILSVDLDPEAAPLAGAAMRGRKGAEDVHFFTDTADGALQTFAQARRRFTFCFIDHSHSYEHVLSACRLLPAVLEPGAFCLFHDYNDQRNSMSDIPEYGVYQGVSAGLELLQFRAYGIFGCCGLFRFGR